MKNILQDFSDFSQYEHNHITEEMIDSSYYGDYSEYVKNDYAVIGGEIALWRAVLLQYLIDLKIKSDNKKYSANKKSAYKWFFDEKNKHNVETVCKYAGYEYRKVMSFVKEIAKNNNSYDCLNKINSF